jgi:hypothetical protein
MNDLVLVATVVLAFAVLLTTHVTIAFSLARRAPRWRGALALVVPPLAPVWAWREGMRVRAALWLAFLLVYVASRLLAAR